MSSRGRKEEWITQSVALYRRPATRLRLRQFGAPSEARRTERPLVSIVIPCFNEAEGLGPLVKALDDALDTLPEVEREYAFVNDGSRDSTLEALLRLVRSRHDIVVADLSRNFGKEAALTAGLRVAAGDVVIPIDADLQDPPGLIPDMLACWRRGAEVVLAKRTDRSEDSLAKRASARAFYRFANWLADIALPENVGDFRLMDRIVVDTLNALPENRRFMKGLFAWAGFRTEVIAYKREPRRAGQTSFNGWRLWNLAVEGITSFSIVPLRVWTYVGLAVAVPALCWGTWIALRTLIFGVDLPGYASIIVAVLLLGGLQLIGIGVLGEYLGRTYLESKRRPAFVIRQIYRNAQT